MIDVDVYILDYLPEMEKLTATIAWSSISVFSAPEYEKMIKEKDIEKMFKLARKMKLSSILDFPYYIISFKDVSRSFTHQWVRYRIAAHVQQSLRFTKIKTELVDGSTWFVIPPKILMKDAQTIVDFINNALRSGKIYKELLEKGIPPEDARFLLPIATKTHISSAMNAEELLHVIDQRTCFDAQWEIRNATYALLAGLYAISPKIFKSAGPYCISEKVCRGRAQGKCYQDAKYLTEKMKNIGDQLRKKLEKAKYRDFVSIDLTDILGYRVPSIKKKKVQEMLGYNIELDYTISLHIRKIF